MVRAHSPAAGALKSSLIHDVGQLYRGDASKDLDSGCRLCAKESIEHRVLYPHDNPRGQHSQCCNAHAMQLHCVATPHLNRPCCWSSS